MDIPDISEAAGAPAEAQPLAVEGMDPRLLARIEGLEKRLEWAENTFAASDLAERREFVDGLAKSVEGLEARADIAHRGHGNVLERLDSIDSLFAGLPNVLAEMRRNVEYLGQSVDLLAKMAAPLEETDISDWGKRLAALEALLSGPMDALPDNIATAILQRLDALGKMYAEHGERIAEAEAAAESVRESFAITGYAARTANLERALARHVRGLTLIEGDAVGEHDGKESD